MKRIPLFVVLAVGVLAADMAMAKAADRSMTRSSSRETTKSDFRLNALGASAAFVSPQDLDGTVGLGVSADMGRITPAIGLEPMVEFWSNTKKEFGSKATVRDIVVGARGKYFFNSANPKIHPFAGAGLGVHFLNAKSEVTLPGFPTLSGESSDTKLGLDLGGGMATPLSPRDDLHIEGWYGIVSDVSQLALRVGFSHKIGI